jgi:hypothetical protein
VGLRPALERIRRQPRDARQGALLRSAPRRSRPVPDRLHRWLRRRDDRRRSHHADPRAAAALPARHTVPSRRRGASIRPRRSAARRSSPARPDCARCHVPPLFTEPGWNAHTADEIGIDDFQAQRSPIERYRTTPLRGLFIRSKGGFYHDGRFPDLGAVVEHYDQTFVAAPQRLREERPGRVSEVALTSKPRKDTHENGCRQECCRPLGLRAAPDRLRPRAHRRRTGQVHEPPRGLEELHRPVGRALPAREPERFHGHRRADRDRGRRARPARTSCATAPTWPLHG